MEQEANTEFFTSRKESATCFVWWCYLYVASNAFSVSPPSDQDCILPTGHCPLMIPSQIRNTPTLVLTVKLLHLLANFTIHIVCFSVSLNTVILSVAMIPEDYFSLLFPAHLQSDVLSLSPIPNKSKGMDLALRHQLLPRRDVLDVRQLCRQGCKPFSSVKTHS